MYSLKFKNPIEVRMGSPFNVADIEFTGEFIPPVGDASFQDKGTVSSDGRTCYLIEWKSIPVNNPGFCVWRISEGERSVRKSEIIEGCCEAIRPVPGGVELSVFKANKSEIINVEHFS